MDKKTMPTLQFGSIQLPAVAGLPNAFVKGRNVAEKTRKKLDWSNGVGQGWIHDFIEYGLEPFLNTHGYHLGYSVTAAAAYCKSWAFAHVQAKQVSPSATVVCKQMYHTGGEAERDWFFYRISYDDWHQLCSEWYSSEFLDDSDAGEAQQTDLPYFVWNLVNLATSPSHYAYLQAMSDEYPDDEDFMQQVGDDMGAFGGDRRTL
jgi:hypothetical protein